MYTSHQACWDAKNRYGLPEEVPFEYDSIRHIIEGGAVPSTPPQAAEQPATQIAAPTERETRTQTTAAPVNHPEPEGNPVQQSMDLTPPTGTEITGDTSSFPPDPRIPKALRDLMIANNVCEWDIQAVVESRGYFPADVEVWNYPPDFVNGVLVGAWQQVFGMIKEMKSKESLPFN